MLVADRGFGRERDEWPRTECSVKGQDGSDGRNSRRRRRRLPGTWSHDRDHLQMGVSADRCRRFLRVACDKSRPLSPSTTTPPSATDSLLLTCTVLQHICLYHNGLQSGIGQGYQEATRCAYPSRIQRAKVTRSSARTWSRFSHLY